MNTIKIAEQIRFINIILPNKIDYIFFQFQFLHFETVKSGTLTARRCDLESAGNEPL